MALRLDRVSFDYPNGVRALDAVDLAIEAGQSVALIGANGSGKTTLARQLNGLLRPDEGRVLVAGQDVAGDSVAKLARRVGVCFQDPDRQIFSSTVGDEVGFGMRQLGVEEEQRTARVSATLERFGLANDLGRHPGDLEDAERKLLTIASMLVMETPIVVIDEPTVGLDAHGVARIEAAIADLRSEGRTIIGISHDMRFVAESFERVVLLDVGRVVLDAQPAEVFASAHWPRLRAAGLEPPFAALEGDRRGLGSTPTESALLDAIRQQPHGAPAHATR